MRKGERQQREARADIVFFFFFFFRIKKGQILFNSLWINKKLKRN